MSEGVLAPAETAGFTDIGPVRSENEDAWKVLHLSGGSNALLLADGMGGHVGGGEAARGAVDAAAHTLSIAPPEQERDSMLRAAVAAANQAVATLAHALHGMPGTTLVVAIVDGTRATVANVGDSRGYLVTQTNATPVTEDHSWVAEQVRLGRLTDDDVRRHPRRNVITRAVMGDPVEPDLFTVDLEAPGSVLMLCSDGVWEPLADEAIAAILGARGPLDVLIERLCRSALDAGGTDNATAVAYRAVPPP